MTEWQTRFQRWGWYAVGLAIVIALVHGWSLGGTFLSDDYDWVTSAEQNLESGRWWAPLIESSGGNFYRPLQALSFTLDVAIAGRTALVFHLHQLLLFFALCLSLAWLVTVVTQRRGLGYATGLIMAAYPAHHEVVTWVAGRADIFAALFVVVSSALAVQFARRGGWLLFTLLAITSLLAYLGKESALVLPAVHGLSLLTGRWLDRTIPWRRIAISLLPSVVALGVILYIRSLILSGAIGGYRLGGQDRGLNISFRDLTAPLTSAGMLVNINYLRHVFGDTAVVQLILKHFFKLRVALPLIVSLVALALIWWRGWKQWLPVTGLAVGWIFITFVPTLGLSYAIGANLEGSRLFFLPSIGYSLMWAIFIFLVFSSRRRVWQLPAAIKLLVIVFGLLSLFNFQPWAMASKEVKSIRAKLLADKDTYVPSSVSDVLVLGLPSKTFGAYEFLGKHAIRAVMREAAGRPIGVYLAGAERYTDSPFCGPAGQRVVAILQWSQTAKQWSRNETLEQAIASAAPAQPITWTATDHPWTTIKLEVSGPEDHPRYTLTDGQSGLVLSDIPAARGAQYQALDVTLGQSDLGAEFGSRRAAVAWSSDDHFTSGRQVSFTIPAGESLHYSIPLCQYAAWVMADNIQNLRLRPQQSGSFLPTEIRLQPK